MSKDAEMEKRISRLEEAVERLSSQKESPIQPWWKRRAALFKNDLAAYDEAMALGRAWRESEREPETESQVA